MGDERLVEALLREVDDDQWSREVRRHAFTRDLDKLPMLDQLRTFERGEVTS